jgi:hypothetical protein
VQVALRMTLCRAAGRRRPRAPQAAARGLLQGLPRPLMPASVPERAALGPGRLATAAERMLLPAVAAAPRRLCRPHERSGRRRLEQPAARGRSMLQAQCHPTRIDGETHELWVTPGAIQTRRASPG